MRYRQCSGYSDIPPSSLCKESRDLFCLIRPRCWIAPLQSGDVAGSLWCRQSLKKIHWITKCAPRLTNHPECKKQPFAPYLYLSRSLSTTERTTGFLSTESSKGESALVRICLPKQEKKHIIRIPQTCTYTQTNTQTNMKSCSNIPLRMATAGTSTMRNDRRWLIIFWQGGVLSLKHTVETMSMKKALHRFLNWAFWLMSWLQIKTPSIHKKKEKSSFQCFSLFFFWGGQVCISIPYVLRGLEGEIVRNFTHTQRTIHLAWG